MSTIYQNFSYIYDNFMDEIPYDKWCDYLLSLYGEYNITSGHLVELGCGTGTLCKLISQHGFTITGIDLSKDMLKIARKKLSSNQSITLLHENMCEIILDDTVIYDGFYSLCDSINYLLYDEELLAAFCGVKHYLKENGIFIFDLKTKYFYEEILGNQTFCEHRQKCSYIWENSFYKDDNINQYDLTLFTRNKLLPFFRRTTETHHQKAHDLSKVIDLLREAGLEYVTMYEALTQKPPSPTSERVYIVARNTKK